MFARATVSQPDRMPIRILVAYCLCLAALLIAKGGTLLILLFPLASLLVGLWLYINHPPLYVGFTMWLCFVSPGVRRIIDYQAGFVTPATITFTAQVVTAISMIAFVKYLPRINKDLSVYFLVASITVLYGFASGVVQNPYRGLIVINGLLTWLGPVTFGLYIYRNWHLYPAFRNVLTQAFRWMIILLGGYGVIQYLIAPQWDRFWIVVSDLSSRGQPEPLGLRVFSTTAGISSFATVLMIGFLILLSQKFSFKSLLIITLGHLPFFLSTARSVWVSWVVCLFIFFLSVKPKTQMRILVVALVASLCVVPLVTIEPFSSTIQTRLESFTDLSEDSSFHSRLTIYDTYLADALSQPVGRGMGQQIDLSKLQGSNAVAVSSSLNESSLFPLLYVYGWFGSLPYLASLLILVFNLFYRIKPLQDQFLITIRMIVVSILMLFFTNFILIGDFGVLLWAFIGLGLAGRKYNYTRLYLEAEQMQKSLSSSAEVQT